MNAGGPFPLATLRAHAFPVTCLEFSHCNNYLIAADEGGWCILWSVTWRRPVAVWRAHKESCVAVKFTNIFSKGTELEVTGDVDDGNLPQFEILTHGRDFKIKVFRLDLTDVGQYSTELPTSQSAGDDWKVPWMVYTQDVNSLNFCPLSTDRSRIAVPHTLDSDKIDVYDLDSRQRIFTALEPPLQNSPKVTVPSKVHMEDPGPKIKELTDEEARQFEKKPSNDKISNRSAELDLLNDLTTGSDEDDDKRKSATNVKSKTSTGKSKLSHMFAGAKPEPVPDPSPSSNQDPIDESKKYGIVMALLIYRDWLVAGYENGAIAYFDLNTGTCVQVDRVYDQPVLSLSNIINDTFYSTSAGPYLTKHSLSSRCVVSKTNLRHVGLSCVRIRNDCKIVSMTSWDGYARVVSFKSSKQLAAMDRKANCLAFASVRTKDSSLAPEHKSLVTKSTTSAFHDAHWLAVGGKDGRISLYDIY